MKKYLALVLALVLSVSLLAGCSKGDSSSESESSSETPASSVSQEPEVDYNYESLLSAWKTDYDGYWAASDGSYVEFGVNEDDKAELTFYDKDGNKTAYALAKTLEASSKSAFVLSLEYPRVTEDDFSQKRTTGNFLIEKAGGTDEVPFNYIVLTPLKGQTEDGDPVSYAKADTLDDVREAAKNAAKV